MSRKRYTPEQIIGKLREAEVALSAIYVSQTCLIIHSDQHIIVAIATVSQETPFRQPFQKNFSGPVSHLSQSGLPL